MEVKLVVVGGKLAGKEIPVLVEQFVIGRGAECQLRPQSDLVSRRHCAIVAEKGVVTINDFGSTNGTLLNGQRIEERQELKDGDRIKIGTLELEVRLAVSVEGVRKPKVHSVQEAAARTVATSAIGGEDWDVSSWLEADAERDNVIWPAKPPATDEDTATGKGLTVASKGAAKTAAMPAPATKPGAKATPGTKAKEKAPEKVPGRFADAAKPTAENSCAAASDMLKKFFARKKP